LVFVVHILVGTIIFVVLAGAAFGLWALTEWIREQGAPWFIVVICNGMADVLFCIDIVCGTFFAAVEAMKFVRSVWMGWRKELKDERSQG
jgi:hypothetical protein